MTKSNDQAKAKIPAPILAMIHITMAILLGWLLPLPIPASPFVQWLGLGLAAFGFILGFLAVIEFRRARAARDPKKPTKNLVTTGVYRYTRNPIYLGFVLMLVGLPLNMGIYWGVILVWPFITFTNNIIIKHEEDHLRKEFKNEFADYCSRVRRWL